MEIVKMCFIVVLGQTTIRNDYGEILMKKNNLVSAIERRLPLDGHICGILRRRTPQDDKKLCCLCIGVVLMVCLGGCFGCGTTGQDLAAEKQVVAIKEQIIQECPGFLDEATNDFEKTNLLRNWVYTNTIFGEDNFSDYYAFANGVSPNFAALTEGFRNYEVSVYCGGVSTYLALVYNVFGYEAVTLDSALFDTDGNVLCSHVVTLCKISDESGNENWIVQDATFNRAYIDQYGDPLDIYELMSLLKEKRDEDIHYAFGSTQARRVMFSTAPSVPTVEEPLTIAPNTFSSGVYPYFPDEPEIINGRYYVWCDMRQPCVYQAQVQSILNDALVEKGYPPKADYLYLFPVACYSVENVTDPAMTIKTLQTFAAI